MADTRPVDDLIAFKSSTVADNRGPSTAMNPAKM